MVKTFAVLMIVGMLNLTAFSQETRIRFKRGKSSAKVTATLYGGNSRTYVVGARAGQMMTVRVEGYVWFDIGGNEFDESSVTIECRSTDDYLITVHNSNDDSSYYELFVAIN